MQPAALAGRVVGAINRFLHITAGFFQYLAHLPRHVRGVGILVADQYLAQPEKHFSPPWRRRVTPMVVRFARCINRIVYIITCGTGKAADYVTSVCRVEVLKYLTGSAGHPFAADVVGVCFCGSARRAASIFAR